ncbi:MAG: FtsX-like permease family protein [Bacteroidales bacterium]|jgi:lipoprotein-releasing system permease protein|nr:FtsX-like permease family protein [Bacteroidales bacterium]NPV35623.1 FtsX-like permease family protein [Bacteroidales bacterium]
MRFPLFVAFRYLISRKGSSAIHIISLISAAGILVGTAALIVVLSVFNGFGEVIRGLYNSFDPDLKITALQGKVFVPDSLAVHKIKQLTGVAGVVSVIEDNALFRYDRQQHIGVLKGVDSDFEKFSGIGQKVLRGTFLLEDSSWAYALAGAGVAYYLGLNPDDFFHPLEIYVPSRNFNPTGLSAANAFRRQALPVSGIFSIQQDFDVKYIIAPLEIARKLFDYPHEVSALELYLKPGTNSRELKRQVISILGPGYSVADRGEQQAMLYRIMRTEKYAIFIILSFIILVAAFTLISTIGMMAIEKQKDIALLLSMGATARHIRNIFLYQGLLISFTGGLAGLSLGAFVCFLQEKFGFIKINASGNSFVISEYPVQMQLPDFFVVFAIVLLIGFLAAIIPASRASNEQPAFYLRQE